MDIEFKFDPQEINDTRISIKHLGPTTGCLVLMQHDTLGDMHIFHVVLVNSHLINPENHRPRKT